MDDFISRQAAIDEIARWIGYLDEDMINRIQIGLKRLPSAQEQKERDCSTCKHKDLCDAFWTQEIEDAPCSECDELAYQKWEPQELTNNSQKLDSENDEHLATDLQPCNQDCISRQAAIDAMKSISDSICGQQAIDALCELPSAQPFDKDINVPCTDTISRQAAIRWVKTECNPYGKPTLDFESGKKVIEHLKQMPSVQPERRWIPCKEKLPEHSYTEQFLLTVIPNPKYSDSRIVTIGRWGAWADDKDAFDCIKPTNINGMIYNLYQPIPANQVLAWMPLPEPYRKENRWMI